MLLGGQAGVDPCLCATEDVVDIRAENLLKVLGRLDGAAAGPADYVDGLGRVDLLRQHGEVGQGQVDGTGGVGVGEFIGLADVDKLCVVGDFGDLN